MADTPRGPGHAGGLPTVAELDRLPGDACAAALAPLFEGAPAFLGRLCSARPFGDAPTLFARARGIAHAMPEPEQIELIDAHPRLGAPPPSVSRLSFVEQGYDRGADGPDAGPGARAGIDVGGEIGADVVAELARLNGAYEARFGFRYCVFVAGRSRAALLPGFEAALGAGRDAEITRALEAVIDIAADRWHALASGRYEQGMAPDGDGP